VADVIRVGLPVQLLLHVVVGRPQRVQNGDGLRHLIRALLIESRVEIAVIGVKRPKRGAGFFRRLVRPGEQILRHVADVGHAAGDVAPAQGAIHQLARRLDQVGDAVVAGHAVHLLDLVLIEVPQVDVRVLGDVFRRRAIGGGDAHPGDLLIQLVGGDILDRVLHMPVDAKAQPFAGAAAASVHQQVDRIRGVLLVLAEVLLLAQAVVGELLREVA